MTKPIHFHAEPGTVVGTPDKDGRALVAEFPEGCCDVTNPCLAAILDGLAGIVREPHRAKKESSK